MSQTMDAETDEAEKRRIVKVRAAAEPSSLASKHSDRLEAKAKRITEKDWMVAVALRPPNFPPQDEKKGTDVLVRPLLF
jgi:hypothetical protein